MTWGALSDGLAASRAYNELMRRGVPHNVAVRKVFERTSTPDKGRLATQARALAPSCSTRERGGFLFEAR